MNSKEMNHKLEELAVAPGHLAHVRDARAHPREL
jgi:hypothetical protein